MLKRDDFCAHYNVKFSNDLKLKAFIGVPHVRKECIEQMLFIHTWAATSAASLERLICHLLEACNFISSIPKLNHFRASS